MTGINTTGLPQTSDYLLGRGCLFAANINSATGLPDDGGYLDLGHVSTLTATSTAEIVDHFSSRTGKKVRDKRIISEQSINLGFSLEEINFDNLGYFFSGAANGAEVNGDANGTNIVLSQNAVGGRWYDLVDSVGNRVYGMSPAQVEGVDYLFEQGVGPTTIPVSEYTVDFSIGRVLIHEGSSAVGNRLQWDMLTNLGVGATIDRVKALDQNQVEVALKFISENAQNSNQVEYQFHKVTLSADGDLGLLAEQDFASIPMAGSAEINTLVDATSPLYITYAA